MRSAKGESLTSQAYKQLRSDILACRIPPGEKLVISDLVSSRGISLGAVREALSRLTSEGLVVSEPNKGYHVAPITNADLEDLTRVRVLIETECLKEAIARGDLRWEATIISTLFELSRTPLSDPENPGKMNPDWAAIHASFHAALVAACQSPWLLRLREMLYSQSERYRSVSVHFDDRNRDVHAEHQALADATIARDEAVAVALMREHLELTTRILVEANVQGAVQVRAAS